MLHWFRCENCYSFYSKKNPKTNGISMEVYDEIDISSYPIKRGSKYLRQVASIYGPNASGKSNFIKALSSMFLNINGTFSILAGERFLFDDSLKDEPIFCEICFSLPKICQDETAGEEAYNIYIYGYELKTDEHGKANSVSSEWLRMRDLNSNEDYICIYRRTGEMVDFNELVSKETQRKLEFKLDDSFLLLRSAGAVNENEEPFYSVHAWCRSVFHHDHFTEEDRKWQLDSLTELVYQNESGFGDSFEEFMGKLDNCIREVKVDVIDERPILSIGYTVLNAPEDSDIAYRSIEEESEGTQKIAGMFTFFYDALKNGKLLLIDELDIKYHPWAIRDLIDLFHDRKKNNGAQLVFTSHSMAVFNDKDIQIDEIYLIEKNFQGRSSIKRLNKTSVEKAKLDKKVTDFEKLYLSGSFGAIPRTALEI